MHTKEPWSVGRVLPPRIYGADRAPIGTMDYDDRNADKAAADARRVVACVNALAGVSTESLESNRPGEHTTVWMFRQFEELTKQRDEVLAVLESLVLHANPSLFSDGQFAAAQAAISKTKESV